MHCVSKKHPPRFRLTWKPIIRFW